MKGNYKPNIIEDDSSLVNIANEKFESIQLSSKYTKINGSNVGDKSLFMKACIEEDEEQAKDKNPTTTTTMSSSITTTGQVRHYMALLGLSIAVVNLYAQNTFFIAIVEMVIPADQMVKQQPQNTPTSKILPQNMTTSLLPEFTSISTPPQDESCPIEFRYRNYYDSWRFPSSLAEAAGKKLSLEINLKETTSINFEDRFNWDAGMQGVLLGACAVGTAPLQILSGRLAEIYGPKWVLMSAGLGTALTNLLIPALARYSFNLLAINRILMGVSQAGLEPAIVCLMASWLTPGERGFFLSLLLFAMCFGSFIGMLVTSMILSLGYHWSITFYVSGYLNLIISILWLLFASNKPSESKLLSLEELNYIRKKQLEASAVPTGKSLENKENGGRPQNEKGEEVEDVSQAPWGRILSCRAVWAFIICKVSTRWCADLVASELPTYLANVLHLSIKLNGIVNSISAGLFAVFSFLTGYLVKEIALSRERALQENRVPRISKTNLRKMFQALASFGSTLNLVLMVHYDCDLLFSIVMLLVLSCALVLGAGGELQIPYDMTSKYPGTLHGIACSLAVSGWLGPPTVGLILGDEPSSRYRWSIVWHLTAAINFIGGLVFVLLADASARDFDLDSTSKNSLHRQQVQPPPPSDGSSASGTGCLQVVSASSLLQESSSSTAAATVAARDYKKEPAAVARLGPPPPACYVNVVCELAERSAGRLGRESSLLEHQQQQPHQSETPSRQWRRHNGVVEEVGGAALSFEAKEREKGGEDAALEVRLGRPPPEEALFQAPPDDGCSCEPSEQVTGGARGNCWWWPRNTRFWRLWTNLAGRRGKFSIPQLT